MVLSFSFLIGHLFHIRQTDKTASRQTGTQEKPTERQITYIHTDIHIHTDRQIAYIHTRCPLPRTTHGSNTQNKNNRFFECQGKIIKKRERKREKKKEEEEGEKKKKEEVVVVVVVCVCLFLKSLRVCFKPFEVAEMMTSAAFKVEVKNPKLVLLPMAELVLPSKLKILSSLEI